MALSADATFDPVDGDFLDIPVLASTTIYEGALVVVDANGYAVPLAADTNNGRFAGIARAKADNSSGSNGDIKVKVRRGSFYHEVALSGAAQSDLGDTLYASDDNTFTKSATSTTQIGVISGYVASGKILAKLVTDL